MSSSIILRPDLPLRELLTVRHRTEGEVPYFLNRRASIKDIIESLGIPHTEIAAIKNGEQELPFSHIPAAGDKIDLYACTAGTDVTRPTLLRPEPLPAPLFAVDVNVAKLARLLRMAGLDTWYEPGLEEAELVERTVYGRRILLSRSRDILRRKNVRWGRLIRSQQPEAQLAEVINLYGLQHDLKPFSRCMECNARLQPVDKYLILHELEPLTIRYYDSFQICPDCRRIYWQGSHYQRMKTLLQKITGINLSGE